MTAPQPILRLDGITKHFGGLTVIEDLTFAVRRGSRYYACRKTQFWDDAGDVVELLAPGGGLLSQKRY